MSSQSEVIFKLCVVGAKETELKQATSKAWQLYASEVAYKDLHLYNRSHGVHLGNTENPFISEDAGADAEDSRLWFRVYADALYYANNYGSEINDPYDKESIINQLKFIYKSKLQPLIEYELGTNIGIVEVNA